MHRLPALLLLALAAACATSTGPTRQSAPHPQTPWDRFTLDAVALPVVWLQADQEHPATPGRRIDDQIGPGAGLRAAFGNGEQGIGLLYMGSLLEDDLDQGAELHMLYLDFDVSLPLPDGPPGLALRAAAGIGAASLGFDDVLLDDVTTGAANLRIDFEYAMSSRAALLLGIGGFYLGYPGDTEGYGSFVELGGRLSF